MGKYKIWFISPSLKTETSEVYDNLTDSSARKLFTDLKKKHKKTSILLIMGKFRDGSYYGFLRN